MLRLTEVKTILREYNIHPSKRLGQNFLIDQNIKNKIINSIQLNKIDTVLEIGPGLGALTEDLSKKVKRVIAIEKDRRLHDYLMSGTTPMHATYNVTIINGDILKYEFKNISSRLIVIGNLPYSISTPILNKLIDNRKHIIAIYATMQMEFGKRLAASSRTKDYGSLSCYAQFYGEPEILFKIPRGAFFPVPEVDSCFVKIAMEKQIDPSIDQELLFEIIRSSFEKRRKTILNSLSSSGVFKSKEDTRIALEKALISPEARPETVSLKEFITLSRAAN